MNTTELYNAVKASPGPLEDELMARVWCAVHGKEYDGYKVWCSTMDMHALIIKDALGGIATSFAWHERPDISTDAALELVRERFPNCVEVWNTRYVDCPNDATKKIIMHRYMFCERVPNDAFGDGEHKDRRLAIIAALLKAMGA